MRIDDVSRDQSSGNAIEDHAEISSLAQALEDADPKRLDDLRLQVESGRYAVSASELAGRIIDAHTKA
jgi:anti-sigma28 factor (negative regulator of flagellin synthesis)